ncbi:hypothetical protein tinsulaeT_16120 [Thalassotalea insulae]|uniref:DUF541 domain-containing protein n=1 Tax=Thalassotalea insulae TaxID=2056778 RepID=A0ABQ6GUD6_9GAMM|nr:SIMPL domain-containing protein [Thalassotalea insulae]GLX78272.1 hypothetical protein tinsulaeT_16120 [Thalassotalea insulae]
MRILLTLLIAMLSLDSIASNLPDFPFVTVTGESVKKVTPDKATLGFYVTTFDKEATKATSLLNETSNNVVAVLTKNGISAKQISAFEINKRSKRTRDKDYNDLAILGYELSQRFEVTIDNLNQYSEITNELLDINHVENIESQFSSTQREKIEIELIKNAAQKAKLKAEQMAAGLGVELGSVFAFNDSGSFSSFFATFGIKSEARAYAMMSSQARSTNIFVPQYIEIKKSINVIYKLKSSSKNH